MNICKHGQKIEDFGCQDCLNDGIEKYEEKRKLTLFYKSVQNNLDGQINTFLFSTEVEEDKVQLVVDTLTADPDENYYIPLYLVDENDYIVREWKDE